MKTSIFDEFTNQYSVQKTLRFALEPVGETAKHIKDGELLKKDEELARKYKLAKIIIDEYHKDFIHKRLSGFSFKIEDLEDFKSAYEALKADKKNKDEQDKLGEKQEALRKLVSEVFKNDRLFQKEFIKEDLPTWLEQHPDKVENNEEAIGIVKDFEKWTSYFDGFNENRKNIYTAESHSTSISYRLIHENLPRFIDNILRYEKAKELGVDFSEVGNYFDVKLDNVFSLSYFNNCLTQRGIDEYNKIRGGQSKRGNIKEQGVNEKINEYAQQLASQKNNTVDEKKKELKDKRKTVLSCKLEKLHKQILSDRTEISSRLQNINNDGNLCEQIQLFQLNEKDELIGREEIEDEKGNKNTEDFNITKQLREILESISEADAQSIYIKNGKELANISQFLFGDWDVIKRSLENYAENRLLGKNKKGESKRFTEQARESWLKSTYFSFDTIHKALKKDFEQYKDEDLVDNKDEGVTIEMKKKAMSEPLFRYFENLMFRKKNEETDVFEEKELLDEIIKLAPPAFNVLKQYKGEKTETLKNNKKEVSKIKVYLDAVQDLQQFLKPLFVKQKEKEHADVLTEKQPHRKKVKQKEKEHADVLDKDSAFYGDFDRLYEVLEQITPLYNQTRNYLTKKPYNIEKYKLNFENITLADGWDKNKETDNTCVLLRKGEKYFLGVMDRRTAKLFESDNLSPKSIEDSMAENIKKIEEHKAILLNKKEGTKAYDDLKNKLENMEKNIKKQAKSLEALKNTSDNYQKMEYKLLPGASKMLPKVFFSKENINYYNPSDEILRIRNHATHTQKGTPQKGYEKEEFDVKDMRNIIDFFKESINSRPEWRGFGFKFSDTSQYNDLSGFYKEVEHQGYKISFQDISVSYIDQCVEEGELYLFEIYSKDFSPHAKGKPSLQTLYWRNLFTPENLKNVVYKLNGKAELFFRKASIKYDEKIWEQGHHYEELKGKFDKNGKRLPIIKDKRYAKDRYLFHVSIGCNFKALGAPHFNDKINAFLKDNPTVNILGIDRGERHLAYYTLINQKREILQDVNGKYLQGSFNVIESDNKGKIYSKDYHYLLNKREVERDKSRKSWGSIERIKDLKEGYLSQVVHKICRMIVEHNAIVVLEDLNFGFKKGRFKVEKQIYQKLEKMLIDKLNYLVLKEKEPSHAGGVLKALQLTAPFKSFQKMGKQTGVVFYVSAYHTSKICPVTGFVNLLYPHYETVKKAQEFFNKFDLIKFNTEKQYFEFHLDYKKFTDKAEDSKQKWTICSYGKRLENFRTSKNDKWDTREINLTEKFKELFKNTVIDYENKEDIKSDIENQNDTGFFKELIRLLRLTLQLRNSRINSDEDWMISPIPDANGNFFDSRDVGGDVPQNADANGAYHIALKGLWALEQINKGEERLNITNKEWYQFVQEKSPDLDNEKILTV